MTQAAEILVPARASEDKLIAGVCIAHFVSHYYMMLLAPLFVFIKDDYGVTYTELSLALAAFGVVSAVLQTPVGFFVDRFGARLNLIGGLLLGVGRSRGGGPRQFVLGVHRDVRRDGARQHRVSSRRLRAPVASGSPRSASRRCSPFTPAPA